MSLGLIGRKIGMTRIFGDTGESHPVTVLDVSDNYVTQIKRSETDGYTAVQLSCGKRRANRINKPAGGHYSKAGVEAGRLLKEFRVTDEALDNLSSGLKIGTELFSIGQKIDVTGVSIGKGYAGAIKKHNFSSNRASHGNSKAHNLPGSIGMCQDPGRVFPGKRMSGRMGGVRCTTQNLEILKIDEARNLILVKGSIPGSKGRDVFIRPSIKKSDTGNSMAGENSKKAGA